MNFLSRKSVHFFNLYSNASKMYFQKYLFKLIGPNVINIILRCHSNTSTKKTWKPRMIM